MLTTFSAFAPGGVQPITQYKLNGTSLETKNFCRLVNLNKPPPPENQATAKKEDKEDEKEEESECKNEEDIEVTDKEKADVAEQSKEKVNESKSNAKKMLTCKPIKKPAPETSGNTKYLAKDPDGNIVGLVQTVIYHG